MVLTKKSLLNIAFVVWLASELLFQYTLVSQAALLLFCTTIVVCVREIRFHFFFGGLFLFICWSVMNIVTGHTINAHTSWSMTITLVINLVFLLLFAQYYWYIGDIREILRLFSTVVLAFSLACIVVGLPSVIFSGRMEIAGINVNTAAYYVVYASLWCAYLMIFERELTRINFFSLFINISFIVMTSSRGAFFSLLIGMYLLFILYNKRNMVMKIIVVTLIGIATLILVMKVKMLYNLIGHRIEPILDFILRGSFEESSMLSRMKYSALAFARAKESLFWGHGLDCFRHIKGAYGTYSHNNYAEILFSLGATGIVLYYLPYIWNLKYYLTSIFKKNNEIVVISLFLLIYLVSEPFRVTYFNRGFLILPLICYLYMSEQKQKA